ncbi:MAG TPA: hypothetical protein VK171_12340 [Fimbriimonas sp.]|nr:hypothetical protein [Fimbriimonas sp.]
MKSNILAKVALFLVLCVLWACGGGGGTPTDGPVGPVTSVRLEAVLQPSGSIIDPTNIFASEQVKFRLTGIDEGTVGNPRVVIPNTTWTMTGSPAGTLQSNGTFQANATGSLAVGTVTTFYDGFNYSSGVKVVTPQAILRGVGRLQNGFPTRGVIIKCLNAAGTVVGQGAVAADGTIRLSTATTAVKFTADFSSIDPGAVFYVRQFAYNGLDYATSVPGCTAPTPSLTTGVTTPFATDLVFYSSSGGFPPPPPNGCG